MLAILASVGVALLVSGVVIAASGMAAARLLGEGEHLFLASGVVGLMSAGFLVFVGYWITPLAGWVVSMLVLVGSIGYLVLRRAWRWWRSAVPIAMLVLGIALLYLGLLYLWPTAAPMFTLAGTRFSQPLPIDNAIPVLFGDRLLAGLSTHSLVGDWNGSDRPPLQAGLILLLHPVGDLLGAEDFPAGTSVVAQLLWVPALFALLRSAAASRMLAVIGTLMVAVTGSALVNTLYTWPKMLSAALVLCSCALLLEARRRDRFPVAFPLAVLAFTLGLLAHGAAAFALPVVIALGVAAYRGQGTRRVLVWTAAAGAIGLAVYLPWLAYQRFVDSPGDRLLKWHIAGVIPIDSRPFFQTLLDSYLRLSPADWWAARMANLAAVYDPNPLSGVHCFCIDDLSTRRSAEFFTTSAALGLAYPLLVLVLVLVLIGAVRGRRADAFDRRFLATVGLSLASVAIWCLFMFLPGSTLVHQGSQVWLFLLTVAPVVWLAHRRRWLGWAAVGVQAILTLVVYAPVPGATSPDPMAVVIGLFGVAMLAASAVILSAPTTAEPWWHRGATPGSGL